MFWFGWVYVFLFFNKWVGGLCDFNFLDVGLSVIGSYFVGDGYCYWWVVVLFCFMCCKVIWGESKGVWRVC